MTKIQIIENKCGHLLITQNGSPVGIMHRKGYVIDMDGDIMDGRRTKALAQLLGVDKKSLDAAWPEIYEARTKP
jgi:hypothetical protein